MNKTHVFSRDRPAPAEPSARIATLCEGVAAGGAAVVVAQFHVLPPMWCFALLLAGLAVLGATVLLAARWYLPQPQRSSESAIAARRRSDPRSARTRY